MRHCLARCSCNNAACVLDLIGERWPLEGWNGSAIEIYVGWTLLLLPFVIFVGIPALAAVLVVIRLRRPSRPLVIVLAVVVGDGLSTALLTRPFDRDPGVVEVVLAALLFLPIWATYGAVVRLPSAGRQVSLTHAH